MTERKVDERLKPKSADQLLRMMGFTARWKGFQYASHMIERVAENPEDIRLITKNLYPQTAEEFGVSAFAVERAVRTMLTQSWNRLNLDIVEKILGCPVHIRPANADFIDMSAECLRRNRGVELSDWF